MQATLKKPDDEAMQNRGHSESKILFEEGRSGEDKSSPNSNYSIEDVVYAWSSVYLIMQNLRGQPTFEMEFERTSCTRWAAPGTSSRLRSWRSRPAGAGGKAGKQVVVSGSEPFVSVVPLAAPSSAGNL